MHDIGKIISILWKPFIPEIASGLPVYFCFHIDFLNALFMENGFASSDIVGDINNAANSLLSIEGADVTLLPNALMPIQQNFSGAILLVCQQVLAVEAMVRDGKGFSENAYFPRLRKMISPSFAELRRNPFDSEEFEKIWRRLEKEIRMIKGSSNASVTFRFGIERGINKSRSFPMSQALLSRNDLLSITTKIGRDKLLKTKVGEIWAHLWRERKSLHRRGQRLLGLSFLKEKIVEQVISFAQNVEPMKLIASNTALNNEQEFEIRVCKDSLDWVHEDFSIYILNLSTNEIITDEAIVRHVVRGAIEPTGYIILPISSYGDYWVKSNKSHDLKGGETFLIVGDESGVEQASNIIGHLVAIPSKQIVKTPLTGIAGVFIREVTCPEFIDRTLIVRSGRILDSKKTERKDTYQWLGGICLDRVSEKYLKDALPNSLRVNGSEISMNELIRVNDKFISFQKFRESLEHLTVDVSYEIHFPNNIEARLAVGICRYETKEIMGYLFDDKGKLLPNLSTAEEGDRILMGYEERGARRPVTLSAVQCAKILKDLIQKPELRKSFKENVEIVDAISNAKIPTEAKVLIKHLLS